jgi:cardiolipin synthase
VIGGAVTLLDGGRQAYPRMLLAIAEAHTSVHLEVYAFDPNGIGARFIHALAAAANRGVAVRVLIDGWGSARGGRVVAAALRDAGCTVQIHNRLRALLVGRFGRNHRKILVVDDDVAFLGGLNISDQNLGGGKQLASADLAVEIHGPQCARLGQMIRREVHPRAIASSQHIYLCGLGGGWRLRRRYIKAFDSARHRIHIAHGYFLPDAGVVRAITSAARRGVQVHLLLAGGANHWLVRAATRSLYRELIAANVTIREWGGSLLHAKVAIVDGRLLLVGSFNLDRFSLASLETLVEVDDPDVVLRAEEWVEDHAARSVSPTLVDVSSRRRRWLLDPLGRFVARLADAMTRVMARRKHHHTQIDSFNSNELRARTPLRIGEETMNNDTTFADAAQQYAAAHSAHYVSENLPRALVLYTDIMATHPETLEAGYSRTQLQNIVNSVVPKSDLLTAQVELARAHCPQPDTLRAASSL